MNRVSFAIAAVGLLSVGGALSAAPAPVPDTPSEVAACVVDNDPGDVRSLLKTTPGSPAEAAAAVKVMQYYGACNDNGSANGTMAWRERAEIANAALAVRMARKSPDISDATRPGWALAVGNGMVAGRDYDSARVGMRMLGDCAVRAAPQAAVDLVRSAPNSAGERAAIGQLSPVLAPCVPAGQNLRVKRDQLRLIVAEPLYHLLGK